MPKESVILNGKKRCSRCKMWKSINEFHKCKDNKSGLMSWCKECRRKNYDKNKEKIHQRVKEWRKNNRDRALKRQREWYRKNKGRCSEYYRRYWDKKKMEVFIHYGGNPPRCACPKCNETNIKFLTIDHIYNDGYKHRKKIFDEQRGGRTFYAWLIKNNYPEGYQVMCYNCNCGRGHNNGICPHMEMKE